jgi:hypothetical protein
MKNIKQIGIILFTSLMLVSFTNYIMRAEEKSVISLSSKPIEPMLLTLGFDIKPIEINQTELFLNAIGHRESSNRYDIVNKWGYMGKYQFGKKTLKNLGYDVSKKEFLNSPYLQEKAMLDLLEHNKKILQSYIDYWDGRKINGKVITESGILAAAHLAGAGNVKRFLKKGEEFKDGNGTKLTSYLTQFSGYDINLD